LFAEFILTQYAKSSDVARGAVAPGGTSKERYFW